MIHEKIYKQAHCITDKLTKLINDAPKQRMQAPWLIYNIHRAILIDIKRIIKRHSMYPQFKESGIRNDCQLIKTCNFVTNLRSLPSPVNYDDIIIRIKM